MGIDEKLLEELRNNNPSITDLDLSFQHLTDADILVLCDALTNNTHLISLNLEGNQIGDKGAVELAKNTVLERLNLWGNEITDKGTKCLANNMTLVTLDLDSNPLGQGVVNNFILVRLKQYDRSCYSKLRNLKLQGHKLEPSSRLLARKVEEGYIEKPTIEESLELLKNNDPNLTELDLSNQRLGDEFVVNLSGILKKNRYLTSLNLRRDCIRDYGAIALALNTRLVSLDLSEGSRIGNSAAISLAQSETLKILNLTASWYGTRIGLAALAGSKTVTQLFLAHNNIDDRDMTVFLKNTTLTRLDYNFKKKLLGIKSGIQIAVEERIEKNNKANHTLYNTRISEKILKQLRDNDPNLICLDLQGQQLKDDDLKPLVEAVENNTCLLELNVGFNTIEDSDLIRLSKNKTLTTVYFRRKNKLWGKSAGEIAIDESGHRNRVAASEDFKKIRINGEVLKKLCDNDPSIVELNLSDQKLRDLDIIKLCESLRSNTYLKTLDLSRNQIGDYGAAILANTRLLSLNLESNQIKARGAKGLSKNLTLIALNVDNNPIEDSERLAVTVRIEENKKLAEKRAIAEETEHFVKTTIESLPQIDSITQILEAASSLQNQSTMQLHVVEPGELTIIKPVVESVPPINAALLQQINEKNYTLRATKIEEEKKIEKNSKQEERIDAIEQQEEAEDFFLETLFLEDSATVVEEVIPKAEPIPTLDPSLLMQIKEKSYILRTKKIDADEEKEKILPLIQPPENEPLPVTNIPEEPLADNVIFKPSALEAHLGFLKTLPVSSLQELSSLEKQGKNLTKLLPALSHYVDNQKMITQRLAAVESQTGLDAQTLEEIHYIKNNATLERYYEALKTILGQTFLAAQVIASGNVDSAASLGIQAVSGVSAVVGALCPPAAPFLDFLSKIAGIADGIASGRSMSTLSSWVDLDMMTVLASTLARQLTLAQENTLQQALNAVGQKNIKFIENKCSLLVKRIQSGKTLTIEESRAVLDSNELLAYMKENVPKESSLEGRVSELLCVIMPVGYVYNFRCKDNGEPKTAVLNISNTIHTTSANINVVVDNACMSYSHDNAMRSEVEELKKALDEERKRNLSNEQHLKTLSKKIEIIEKEREPYDIDSGDGFAMKQEKKSTRSSAPGAVSLTYLYERSIKNDEAIASLGEKTAIIEENVSIHEKALSKKALNKSHDEKQNCSMM